MTHYSTVNNNLNLLTMTYRINHFNNKITTRIPNKDKIMKIHRTKDFSNLNSRIKVILNKDHKDKTINGTNNRIIKILTMKEVDLTNKKVSIFNQVHNILIRGLNKILIKEDNTKLNNNHLKGNNNNPTKMPHKKIIINNNNNNSNLIIIINLTRETSYNSQTRTNVRVNNINKTQQLETKQFKTYSEKILLILDKISNVPPLSQKNITFQNKCYLLHAKLLFLPSKETKNINLNFNQIYKELIVVKT